MNSSENLLERKIKTLRINRGREFFTDEFKRLCDEKEIQWQLTIFYTPQQNNIVERWKYNLTKNG